MVNRKPNSLPVRKNKQSIGKTGVNSSTKRQAAGRRDTASRQRNTATMTYKQMKQEYLYGRMKLDWYQKIGVLLLIVVFAGFAGWVWEWMLAEIGGRFHGIYIEGGNLLPWVNLYAYGAIVIILATYWARRHAVVVFAAGAVACGLLECFAGWIVYVVGNGTRYWDYRDSWWGIGNIDGFVCPASATAFGLGALLLMYFLLPRVLYMARTMSRRAFLSLAISLFTVVMVDDVTNLVLKNLGLPTAHSLYHSLGWEYKV